MHRFHQGAAARYVWKTFCMPRRTRRTAKYFITGARTSARETQKKGPDAPPRPCLSSLVYHSFFKKYT